MKGITNSIPLDPKYAPAYIYSTVELEDGISELESGVLYIVYEE